MLEFLGYFLVAGVLAFNVLWLRGWDYIEEAIYFVGERLDPVLDRIHREGRSPSFDQASAIIGFCLIFALLMSLVF